MNRQEMTAMAERAGKMRARLMLGSSFDVLRGWCEPVRNPPKGEIAEKFTQAVEEAANVNSDSIAEVT